MSHSSLTKLKYRCGLSEQRRAMVLTKILLQSFIAAQSRRRRRLWVAGALRDTVCTQIPREPNTIKGKQIIKIAVSHVALDKAQMLGGEPRHAPSLNILRYDI